MTRLTALLRLWRDADELATLRDHVCHLETKLELTRPRMVILRERLARAELIEHAQAVHIDTLRAELAEAHRDQR